MDDLGSRGRGSMDGWIMNLAEDSRESGQTTFWISGRYMHSKTHRLVHDIFHGCPVFSDSPCCISTPDAALLKTHFLETQAVVFADDAAPHLKGQAADGEDKKQLESALVKVLDYYQSVHVHINNGKWRVGSKDDNG